MKFEKGKVYYCDHCFIRNGHTCIMLVEGNYKDVYEQVVKEECGNVPLIKDKDGPCYKEENIVFVTKEGIVKGNGLWCPERPEMREATKKEIALFTAWRV